MVIQESFNMSPHSIVHCLDSRQEKCCPTIIIIYVQESDQTDDAAHKGLLQTIWKLLSMTLKMFWMFCGDSVVSNWLPSMSMRWMLLDVDFWCWLWCHSSWGRMSDDVFEHFLAISMSNSLMSIFCRSVTSILMMLLRSLMLRLWIVHLVDVTPFDGTLACPSIATRCCSWCQ